MDSSPPNQRANNYEQIRTTSDENEDDVRIAASALDDMRAGASTHENSNRGTPPVASNAATAAAAAAATDQAVSRLPAVLNSAMHLYDYGKANSRVISYGAGVVESSVVRPVLDRLPTRVLNYGRSQPTSARTPPPEPSSMQIDASERDSSSSDPSREEQRKRALSWTHEQREARRMDNGGIPASNDTPHSDAEIDEEEEMDLSNPDREQSSTLSDRTRFSRRSDSAASPSDKHPELPTSQALSHRAGWQSLMVEAGGFSAAISDESMKRLKYCLEWLQWATANLDTQISLLEIFIDSITATITGDGAPSATTVSPEALQHYMSVKRNVVNTIRQVVEVVGKYAGGSLPEPAKHKVKGFILSLPGRWSVAVKDAGLGDGWERKSGSANNPDGVGTAQAAQAPTVNPRKRNRLELSKQSLVSESSTRSSSDGTFNSDTISTAPSSVDLATPIIRNPVLSPSATKRSQLLPPTAGAAKHAAHRVLTLAQESLHAVRGVTAVFKDTLDRAETWVERFRRVGYGQTPRYVEDSDTSAPSSYMLPPHYKHPSQASSPSISSPRGRRLHMTPRELHLEALARAIPSVGPYGPYGTGTTPPMSPILSPHAFNSSNGHSNNSRFPFDNPAPGAPGYGWIGGRRKSDSGLGAIPTLNLSERNHDHGGRSRAGSLSQYEDSLPPPSVIGSTSSVAGDDELDEEGEYETRRGIPLMNGDGGDEDEGMEYRVRKRRRKEVS